MLVIPIKELVKKSKGELLSAKEEVIDDQRFVFERRRFLLKDGHEVIYSVGIAEQRDHEGPLDSTRFSGVFKACVSSRAIRKMAGLTQTELAELIGSKQPVIARLEDADYEGHSLTMLQRIAIALNQRVEINFVPLEGQQEVV